MFMFKFCLVWYFNLVKAMVHAWMALHPSISCFLERDKLDAKVNAPLFKDFVCEVHGKRLYMGVIVTFQQD